jgi:hypothetical protein
MDDPPGPFNDTFRAKRCAAAKSIWGNGMASRSTGSSDIDRILIILVAVLGGGAIWVFIQVKELLNSLRGETLVVIIGGVVALIILAAIAWQIQRKRTAEKRLKHQQSVEQAADEKVNAIIKHQMPSLLRRREQLVRQDAYGKPLLKDWIKELSYFTEEHVKPLLTPEEQLAVSKFKPLRSGEWLLAASELPLEEFIDALVEIERNDNPAFPTFSDDMTPNEFEPFCAEELRRAGWDARVTKQSHDQGVDVVAERNGIRVVVQCKLYSHPVGNKAVQEIAAARAHEQADYGVVVSNNRYTQEAEQLATTNKILLLHYTDLHNLHNIIPLGPAASVDAQARARGTRPGVPRLEVRAGR